MSRTRELLTAYEEAAAAANKDHSAQNQHNLAFAAEKLARHVPENLQDVIAWVCAVAYLAPTDDDDGIGNSNELRARLARIRDDSTWLSTCLSDQIHDQAIERLESSKELAKLFHDGKHLDDVLEEIDEDLEHYEIIREAAAEIEAAKSTKH